MTSLPSNNYADRAVIAGAAQSPEATTTGEFGIMQAVLAVAEELRTANLIAERDSYERFALHPDHDLDADAKLTVAQLQRQINKRLGLNDADA